MDHAITMKIDASTAASGGKTLASKHEEDKKQQNTATTSPSNVVCTCALPTHTSI